MKERILVVVVAVVCFLTAAAQAVTTIPAGWDLLETRPGTMFAGIPFQGVPLGLFDFGVPIGVQPTGTTDTIVQRLAPAIGDPPATAVIPIELVALQLQSVVPVDPFSLGIDFYYITLQSARGGPGSPGSMTINFSGGGTGTFDSFFDVFFDIRKGSLGGPIVFSGDEVFNSFGTPWDTSNPPLHIPGVNDGFNPQGIIVEQGVGTFPAAHVVGPAQPTEHAVPEPVTAGLSLLGLSAVVLRGLLRRRI